MAEAVVIGANGFLGAQLVDALARAGLGVTAFDRFTSARAFREPVRVLTGDFLNGADLAAAVAGQDYVFHFLSTTTPATAESDPTLDIRTNLAQTVELLQACVAAGVKHVYFASTGGAIYGQQSLERYSEEALALPVSPYGIGKLSIEHYLHYFRVRYGLSSTALRISNPYGPGQRARHGQGFIPIALTRVAAGEPVIRFGDGSMTRDYLFVDDLITMVLPMIGQSSEHDLYNIGSGTGHTVSEVLDVVAEVTGREVAVEERPIPPTFVDHVVLDVSRYRAEFGAPRLTPLREGVARLWDEMGGRP